MGKIPNQELDQWIARYDADRARAQEKVDWIEKQGRTFQEKRGNEPWRDAAGELLASWKADVKLYEGLIAFYQ